MLNPSNDVTSAQALGELSPEFLEERHRVLYEFNRTVMPYPGDGLIHELFDEQARRTPDAIALIDERETLSYAQLGRKAGRLAQHLFDLGVRQGDCVPLVLPRSANMVVAQLAVLKAGAIYVPIDPGLPLTRQTFMVNDCGARRALDEQEVDVLLNSESIRDCIRVNGGLFEGCFSGGTSQHSIGGLTPAYVMYTSGSTGAPKGVIVAHRGVIRLVINCGYVQLQPDDSFAHCSNPAFDAATFEIWGALLNGCRVVVLSQSCVLNPKSLAEQLERHAVSILLLTTALFNQHALEFPGIFRNLRYVLFGGEVADPNVVRRVLERGSPRYLLHMYGPTETTTFATCWPVVALDLNAVTVPIGRPISNTQIYILDEERRPVSIGETGEIYIGGEGVAVGYLNRPELNQERFIPDSFAAISGGHLYKTGDLARWRADGSIEFLGRNDFQVKIRGYRIELGEVEEALRSDWGVRQALVMAREDVAGERCLVGYVVPDFALLEEGAEASGVLCEETSSARAAQRQHLKVQLVSRLRASLRDRLPPYMVPAALVVVDELPLTANGKVDRHALPVPDLHSYSTRRYEEPEGPLEAVVARIWEDALRVEPVGRDDNFFELGGHSLLGARVILRIAEKLATTQGPVTIFQYPTVRRLAQFFADQLQAGSSAASRPAQRKSSEIVPLTFAQRYFWNELVLKKRHRMQWPIPLRLNGPLDVDSLQRTFKEIVRRHESLRTKIRAVEGQQIQVIDESVSFELKSVDFSGISADGRELVARQMIEQMPKELAVSEKLFDAKLLRLADDDHILVILWDLLIQDGASMGILWRDIWTLYTQFVRRLPPALPSMPLQFGDYAVWQEETQRSWMESHGAYWHERLAGAKRLRLFPRAELPTKEPPKWSFLNMHFDDELCARLRTLSRREGTTLVMCFVTAFVAALSRCCETADVVVPFITMGRPYSELENVIGSFGSLLFLRFELRAEESYRDLLRKVSSEYASACEHDDLCRIAAQSPEPEFVRNPIFNWLSRDLNMPRAFVNGSGSRAAYEGIEVQDFRVDVTGADGLMLDEEHRTVILESENGISGWLRYRANRASERAMRDFDRNFHLFLERLATTPEANVLATPRI